MAQCSLIRTKLKPYIKVILNNLEWGLQWNKVPRLNFTKLFSVASLHIAAWMSQLEHQVFPLKIMLNTWLDTKTSQNGQVSPVLDSRRFKKLDVSWPYTLRKLPSADHLQHPSNGFQQKCRWASLHGCSSGESRHGKSNCGITRLMQDWNHSNNLALHWIL